MNSSPENEPGAPAAQAPAPGAPREMGLQTKLIVAGLVVCALAALFWPRGEERTFKEPGGFLYDAQGRPAKLGSQLAPVSLVHFWATWCPPCIDEIPALQRLSRDFGQHESFDIVMVAVQDDTKKVTTFLGKGWDMVLFDPDWDVANRYGTDKLPETYLVVRGEVVEKFVGQTDWDNPELRRKLTSLLGETAPKTAAIPGSTP